MPKPSSLFPPELPLPDPPGRSRIWTLLYFLGVCSCCTWLIFQSFHPLLPQPDRAPRLYSNQCRQDLRLLFISALEQAKESIYLVMFGLNDPALIKTIASRIQSGISTTLYYDPSGSSKRLHSSLRQAHLHAVQRSGLMHQKILIVDRDLVFIGSANMTSASLRMHDNLVVGLRNERIAGFLSERAPYRSGYLRTCAGGQDIELWLLPDRQGHALADLRRKLQSATSSIRIALFTFTHPDLIDDVIAAYRRGIATTAVIDLHSGLGASAKAINRLREAGVRVFLSQGIQLLHHKFVLIDDEILLSGSANWTKAAFAKNSDCILALHRLSYAQRKFMKQLWRRIETEARLVESQ